MKKRYAVELQDDSLAIINSTQVPRSSDYKRVFHSVPVEARHGDELIVASVLNEDTNEMEDVVQVDPTKEAAHDAALLAEVNSDAERMLRAQRNAILDATDYTQIPDAPLTAQQVTDYATYRQELRDLPANTVDPTNPTWPTKPS